MTLKLVAMGLYMIGSLCFFVGTAILMWMEVSPQQ